MMTRGVILLLLGFLMLAPHSAMAAVERPRLDVQGFSPDGRFFAFRQSGMTSSGSAFADQFVIDVNHGKAVKNTPLRVYTSATLRNLTEVRAAVAAQADRLFGRIGLKRAVAGVVFKPRDQQEMWLDMPWGERVSLNLLLRNDISAAGCSLSLPIARADIRGFHLTLQRPQQVTILASDKSPLPKVRGCPVSYRFASGFVKDRGTDAVIAALIAYHEPEMSGETHVRYLAVTAIVKAPKK